MKRNISTCYIAIAVTMGLSSCNPLAQNFKTETRTDEDLRLTLGGFREGHPDEGEVSGVCGTDSARNVLDCDVYNGLQGWTVSEITLVVTWLPYKENDKRYFAEHVSIPPLKTEHVSIGLGLRLPNDTQLIVGGRPFGKRESHWGWEIVAAKGYRAINAK